MIRSIRLTLTVWYVGILAAILCLFGWVLYTNVSANLSRDIDQILTSQADGVADAIYTFWQAEWEAEHPVKSSAAAKGPARIPREIQKEVESSDFTGLIIRWSEEMSDPEAVRPLRVIDRQGRVLLETEVLAALKIPLTESALTQAQQGFTVYETFNLSDRRFRIILRPIIENDHVLYFVQTSAGLRHIDVSLARLKLWILWLVPLTLVFASAIGWFLARAALHPIRQMIGQAQQIGAAKLHERIDPPRTGDELEQLAVTFNDMLSRLERAFKRLRQFSAAASHELRTPLTVMKGELEIALRVPRDTPEYQRVLKTQLEALDEMVDIVEQLLVLARSEEGEEAVEWRPVELTKLVRQVAEAWRTITEAKGVQVDLPSTRPVWVRGEERLLERLASNLLDNALKHTPPAGRVFLRTERDKKVARLIVQDTGPGIPPDELPKIFDKFFSRFSGNDRDHSTGLGLGLCRWIAEAHRGRIEVSSPPGQGATFTVWFPTD